jgi:hypothetical protein
MSKTAVVGSQSTKESQSLVLSGATSEEVADKVALFLASKGYRLETGSKTQGVYGRGSSAGHFLLGPLGKRTKFNVTIGQEGGNVRVVLAKGMTGMGGGLLAAGRVKKEYAEICQGVQEALLQI